MKKLLTVSLLAIMSVSAANAKIASTDYADRIADAAASEAVTDLVTTGQVKTNTTDIADLKSTINDTNTGLATKASSADLNQAKQDLQDAITAAISGDSGVTKQIQALEENKLDKDTYEAALGANGDIGKKLDASTYNTDMADTGTYGSKIKANADAVSALGTTKLDASTYNTDMADTGTYGSKIKANAEAVSTLQTNKLDASTYNTDMSDTGKYGSKIKASDDALTGLATDTGVIATYVNDQISVELNTKADGLTELIYAAQQTADAAQEAAEAAQGAADAAQGTANANAQSITSLGTSKLDAATYNTDMSDTGKYGSKIKANADAVSTLQTNSATKTEMATKATKAELGINGTLTVPTECQGEDKECALVIINGKAEWQIVQK